MLSSEHLNDALQESTITVKCLCIAEKSKDIASMERCMAFDKCVTLKDHLFLHHNIIEPRNS